MKTSFSGVLIVVPTRNRVELAINAIRSVLDQDCSVVRLLVSDNSTRGEEVARLAEYCREIPQDRLSYIRPPEPLPMSSHWSWALEWALERSTASHFAFLTDRMVFRSGELHRLVEIVRSHPERVVSYNHDRIADHLRPIRVQRSPWTGGLYEIEATELLSLVSQAVLYHPALPKLLNCVVPRLVLNAVRERFGNLLDSISPDFNFCFRSLEVVDTVLFYDSSAIVHYALDRSNGMGLVRGKLTAEHRETLAREGRSAWHFATPVPQVQTVGNAILHEYCRVKQQTGSPRFPDLQMERYLEYLAREVDQLEDPETRAEMRSLLAAHGWKAASAAQLRLRRFLSRAAQLGSPRRIWRGILWLSTSSLLGQGWLYLARRFSVRPPIHNRLGFDTVEDALAFATGLPPRRSRRPVHLPGRWRPAARASHPSADPPADPPAELSPQALLGSGASTAGTGR